MRLHRTRLPWKLAVLAGVLAASVIADSGSARAAPGTHIWSHMFVGDFNESPSGVVIDSAGNSITVGGVSGTIDLGGGPLTSAGNADIWLAKHDPAGTHVWSKLFGSTNTQLPDSIAIDGSDNVVISGSFFGTVDFGGGPLVSAGQADVYVAKFDGAGNHLWSQRFGDADYQWANSVATDSAGNVLLAGRYGGALDFGGGPLPANLADAYLAKLDPAGNHVWSEQYGTGGDDGATAVTVDSLDNILIAGWFKHEIDFGGGPLTSVSPYSDAFLAKLDPSGAQVWSQQIGDPVGETGAQEPSNIVVDESDDVMLVGAFSRQALDNWDAYIALRDGDTGDELWSKLLGSAPAGQYALGAEAANGSYIVTGVYHGTIDFGGGPMTGGSAYLAAFSVAGTHLWSTDFDVSSGSGAGVDVGTDPWGHVVLTGSMTGSIDFGGGVLTSRIGSEDTFLVKLHGTSVPADSDGDGCVDGEEVGPNITLGGRRDPDNPWDFYDVNASRKVDAVDVAVVRSKFGETNPDPTYDRSQGMHPWAPGPPDLVINALDIGLVRGSFSHSCQAAP